MELKVEVQNLLKLYHEKRLAHAFLVETNNIEACIADLTRFVKMICCENQGDNHDEEECNICGLIDNSALSNFMIIEPDGLNIRKSQIMELKERFQAKPIIVDYNIYVLKNSEKLNPASANTMLKFLEEPDGDVIGFFVTTNRKSMINTIVSRCQYLKFIYDEADVAGKFGLQQAEYEQYVDVLKQYLEILEDKNNYGSLYNKKLVLSTFGERRDLEKFFLLMLNVYESVYKIQFGDSFAIMDVSSFEFLLKLTLAQLSKRMSLVKKILLDLRYNVNTELLLDKFAIEMRKIDG